MGQEELVFEKPEAPENQNVEVEEMAQAVTDNKGEQQEGVTEMEEDKIFDDGKVEAQDIVVEKEEVTKSKEVENEVADEKVAQEGQIEETKEETESDEMKRESTGEEEENNSGKMVEDSEEATKNETGDKVEKEVDEVKEEEEKPEKSKEEKGSKKRPRTKRSSAGKKDKNKKKEPDEEKESKTPTEKKTKEPKTSGEKKEKELKTPTPSTIERPVRERKSVERLVAVVEKDSAKEFRIEKGRGTALRNIPNGIVLSNSVAVNLFQSLLSVCKECCILRLFHYIYVYSYHSNFGVLLITGLFVLILKVFQAAQVKNNISVFSGFVWHDNEEKQMIKVKEKLEKCMKEKLVKFCDVLDIPISKSSTKKEDIIAKLADFLMEPHATTSELLMQKEQSSKGKKRSRPSKSGSESITSSKGSSKSRKKTESSSKGGETKSTRPASEDDMEKEDDTPLQAPSIRLKKNDDMSAKKSSGKKKDESIKKSPLQSPSIRLKNIDDISVKKSSGEKKDESIKKSANPKKLASKKRTRGKKVQNAKDKSKGVKLQPDDNELREAISEILKDVDFNTATFNDILKPLAKRFDMDFTHRKTIIKLIIQDELTQLAGGDEADDEDEDEDAADDENDVT
ncbi:hypothetical protein ACJIZ3_007025 [Penstemon smallii]|uniref:DEK-C domain-containing protein n=1 Tax=Penstemon smallii TaxID=265156 RepID=A0ABD3S9D1_9LAMI